MDALINQGNHSGEPGRAEIVLAKWQTPADEAIGVSRLVQAIVERGICEPGLACIATPNAAWAQQIHRACEMVGQRSTVCIGNARLEPAAQEALCMLAMLASPTSPDARGSWMAYGHGDDEADEITKAYASSRGFTLLRATGLAAHAAFETALLHVQGDEDAGTLYETVRQQLAHPSLPADTTSVPITLLGGMPCDCLHAFLVGCVDGLVPGPGAYEGDDEQARDQALRDASEAFFGAITTAQVRTVVSVFSKAEAGLAQAARIRFSRTRVDDGRTYAVCAPTPFLARMGTARPTTTGGQTLLRAYDLN